LKPATALVVETEPQSSPLTHEAVLPRTQGTVRVLPQLEFDCMVVLWAEGSATVGEARALLEKRGRRLAYTTVLTVMDRLLRKQVVTREKRGRAFVYLPQISREMLRDRALENLVRNFFGGSMDELRRYLGVTKGQRFGSQAQASSEEIDASLL
jgi:predicted transcriptional regulator